MKSVLSNLPDEMKAARGPALASEPASVSSSRQDHPRLSLLSKHPKSTSQGRLTPWGKTRLNNYLGLLEDILSQGHLQVWESIFLQTTAVDVICKRLIDQIVPKTYFPLALIYSLRFQKMRKLYGKLLNLSRILVQSNP